MSDPTTRAPAAAPGAARTHGIHHVTAIAGDPQRNLHFYAGVLGLRFVKRTVNFDDPTTYHFYFGDATGAPGSILTFFPWPDGQPGRVGTGQVADVALAIPPASLGWWLARLVAHGVRHEIPTRRFGGEQVLALRDPDGLRLELVAHAGAAAREGWGGGAVPSEHAVRGIHGVTLWEDGLEDTAALLTGQLGFREVASDGATFRYAAGDAAPGAFVDVRVAPDFWSGATGVGTVHHVAFRMTDDAEQAAVRQQLAGQGLNVTPPLDRQYFRSVYFREPGGVLFELATDAPGFLVDEPFELLGTTLRLPPQHERMRGDLERVLPPLDVEAAVRGAPTAAHESAFLAAAPAPEVA